MRYAGCVAGADDGVLDLLAQTIAETEKSFVYRVCYLQTELDAFYKLCPQAKESKDFAKWTDGCEEILLFCATVGLDIDRKIAQYSRLSPAKAVLAQAIGAERIESLCDVFCQDMEKEYGKITARYSAGYGDFSLSAQREIFSLLQCEKHIGLTLTQSLLMSPTKSVSAIVGINPKKETDGKNCKNSCETCVKRNCAFRIDG